jgi:tetratricopeptide (TPR) repeat protein
MTLSRCGLPLALTLLLPPAIGAQDQSPDPARNVSQATPAEQFRDLLKEYQQAQEAFFAAYREAKTDEDREKIIQKTYPNPASFADRFLKLAEDHPKDSVAIDALVWVATNSGFGPAGAKAFAILGRDHVTSPKLGPVVERLGYAGTPEALQLLRAVLRRSVDHDIQGKACLALAQALNQRAGDDQAQRQEAEALFQRVLDQYADVKAFRGTLADTAKRELYEIRNLAIGMPAPEISGEDIDGRPMKLSEFRGKVVVLDFWGHW